jgi:hypothetical protein
LLQDLCPTGVAYIPLVDDSLSSEIYGRVIGFGQVSSVQSHGTGGNGLRFTKAGGRIAARNASATLAVALPRWFRDSTAGSLGVNRLFSRGYLTEANALLLAPVLVNHYLGP